MSDVKKMTIPSLTEGKEPYEIGIPKITARHHREMMMLQSVGEIKDGEAACEEAEGAYEKAVAARKESEGLIEALEIAEADPVLIADKKSDHASACKIVDELQRKLEKTKKQLEQDKAKVEEHFGDIPDLEIDEVGLTYLLIGKDILGEPWAVMACCGLGPEDWVDIDYEEYANICKELLRRNPRFFKVRHRKAA